MVTTLALQSLVIQVSHFSLFSTSLSHYVKCFSALFSIIILSYNLLTFSPEAHPDVIGSDGLATAEGYQKDLEYLKSKV